MALQNFCTHFSIESSRFIAEPGKFFVIRIFQVVNKFDFTEDTSHIFLLKLALFGLLKQP